jgi:hypothetical protein
LVYSGISDLGIPFNVKGQLFVVNQDHPFLQTLAQMVSPYDPNKKVSESLVMNAVFNDPIFLNHFGFKNLKTEKEKAILMEWMFNNFWS